MRKAFSISRQDEEKHVMHPLNVYRFFLLPIKQKNWGLLREAQNGLAYYVQTHLELMQI